MKKALITGITGQDGAYLTEFLIAKGYEVHGLRRRTSLPNTDRIEGFMEGPQVEDRKLHLHYGDMTDSSNLTRLVQEIQPDEIYNLAAQSHVHVSFSAPEYTANTDALGALRLLEAIRFLKLADKTRFYQASTSELYGKIQEPIQSETTPFYPRSPYAVAKLYAYWMTVNYREAYNMYACNGILFNHESPLRGDSFVTRKVTMAVPRVLLGMQDALYMGNIYSERDWGHAKDFVEMQWMMLQQDQPEDFVIATGEKYSVKDFINISFNQLGVQLDWKGEGVDEVGIVKEIDSKVVAKQFGGPLAVKTGDTVLKIDPYYFRPTEVDRLIGDPTKAREKLGWEPRISFQELVTEMVEADLLAAKKQFELKKLNL